MSIELVSTGIPDLLPMKRSPGLHHSEVLKDFLVSTGYKQYEDKSLDNDNDKKNLITRWQLGSAFEDIIADRYDKHFPGKYIRSSELEIDGLVITPDLITSSDCTPDSIKLTWLSSRNDINSDTFTYHWLQLASECVALGVDIARLHICHVNGAYDYGNPAVHFNVWQRQFNPKWLDSHRTRILRHRDKMLREGWEQK